MSRRATLEDIANVCHSDSHIPRKETLKVVTKDMLKGILYHEALELIEGGDDGEPSKNLIARFPELDEALTRLFE